MVNAGPIFNMELVGCYRIVMQRNAEMTVVEMLQAIGSGDCIHPNVHAVLNGPSPQAGLSSIPGAKIQDSVYSLSGGCGVSVLQEEVLRIVTRDASRVGGHIAIKAVSFEKGNIILNAGVDEGCHLSVIKVVRFDRLRGPVEPFEQIGCSRIDIERLLSSSRRLAGVLFLLVRPLGHPPLDMPARVR